MSMATSSRKAVIANLIRYAHRDLMRVVSKAWQGLMALCEQGRARPEPTARLQCANCRERNGTGGSRRVSPSVAHARLDLHDNRVFTIFVEQGKRVVRECGNGCRRP